MFISPKYAIEQGWVTGIKNPDKQIQPNAIDFTLDTLFAVSSQHAAHISESGKKMATLVAPDTTINNEWILLPKGVYDGTSDMYVTLPEGVAAILYTRSTFARNGVFLMSGLYDSGYNGHIGFTLYSNATYVNVEPGTRVGQIAFVKSDSAGLYAGGWNHTQGTHYKENV